MKLWIQFVLVMLGSKSVFSQSNTTAGGGECNGTGGTVSFSLGQIDHADPTDGAYVLTEGVQQPYAQIHVRVAEARPEQDMAVFPNPSTGQFVLNVGKNDGLQFLIHDRSGRLVETGRVDHIRTVIDLSHFADGAYTLSVIGKGEVTTTFDLHLVK